MGFSVCVVCVQCGCSTIVVIGVGLGARLAVGMVHRMK